MLKILHAGQHGAFTALCCIVHGLIWQYALGCCIQLTSSGREVKKIRMLIKKANILVRRGDLIHA
jgi:hypothetical protein